MVDFATKTGVDGTPVPNTYDSTPALTDRVPLTGKRETALEDIAPIIVEAIDANASAEEALGAALAGNVQAVALLGIAASVKKFGAVGDGTTNDTADIATALTSGAKWIHFPAGTYLVDEFDIASMSGVKITGEGVESVIKHTASDSPFYNNSANYTWARMNECNDCTISSLTFQSVSGSKGTFAALANTDCIIERCKFFGAIDGVSGGLGHFTAIGNTRNKYLHNTIDGDETTAAKIGLAIGFYSALEDAEVNAIVEGNVVINNSGTSLSICGFGNRVTNNTVKNGGTSGSGSGIITAGSTAVQSRDNVIAGNTVDGVPWSCIQCDSVDAPDINTQIVNNNLTGFGLHGVQLRECQAITVNGNNISKGSGAGTTGVFVSEYSYGWAITNNNLFECNIYLLSGAGTTPIGAGRIENNTLYSCPASNAGIMVQANNGGDIKDVSVRENLFVDMATGNHTYRTAIASPATGTGIEFLDNRSSLSTATPYVDHVGTLVDGAIAVAGASISSAADAINTTGKYPGKLIWNIATQKKMSSSGTATTSAWIYTDGSGSITPS